MIFHLNKRISESFNQNLTKRGMFFKVLFCGPENSNCGRTLHLTTKIMIVMIIFILWTSLSKLLRREIFSQSFKKIFQTLWPPKRRFIHTMIVNWISQYSNGNSLLCSLDTWNLNIPCLTVTWTARIRLHKCILTWYIVLRMVYRPSVGVEIE